MRRTKIVASVLGILGGLLGLAIFQFALTALVAPAVVAGPPFVLGIPAAAVLGGAITLFLPAIGGVLMGASAFATLMLYGINTYAVAAFALSFVGCVLALYTAAKEDQSQAAEPMPIIAGLARFYADTPGFAWFIVRVTAGGMLLVHGVTKLTTSTIAAFAANSMARRGIEPALPMAYAVWFLETIGAICIMLGLFTRVFAVAIGIEFLIITFHAHYAAGFGWNRPGGGWEYPLFWGLIWLAIALRGGGPYSLDRKLGREF